MPNHLNTVVGAGGHLFGQGQRGGMMAASQIAGKDLIAQNLMTTEPLRLHENPITWTQSMHRAFEGQIWTVHFMTGRTVQALTFPTLGGKIHVNVTFMPSRIRSC